MSPWGAVYSNHSMVKAHVYLGMQNRFSLFPISNRPPSINSSNITQKFKPKVSLESQGKLFCREVLLRTREAETGETVPWLKALAAFAEDLTFGFQHIYQTAHDCL